MPKILTVMLVLLVASVIEADALQGRILSFGTNACEDFVAAPEQSQQMYLSWAVGFISGANMFDQSDARLTGSKYTPGSFLLWLKNYCTQKPLAVFVEAASKLREELAVNEGLKSR